jgi:hypothetical protein
MLELPKADDRPLTADEIVGLLSEQIRRTCEQPAMYVSDVGEFDSKMFTLHWLYATSTGRLGQFCDSMANANREDFARYMSVVQSHESVSDSPNLDFLKQRWKKYSDAIGLS